MTQPSATYEVTSPDVTTRRTVRVRALKDSGRQDDAAQRAADRRYGSGTPLLKISDDLRPFRRGDTVRLTAPGDTLEAFDARGTVVEDSSAWTGQTRVEWHGSPFSTTWHDHAALTRTDPGQVPAILAAMERTHQQVRAAQAGRQS